MLTQGPSPQFRNKILILHTDEIIVLNICSFPGILGEKSKTDYKDKEKFPHTLPLRNGQRGFNCANWLANQ